MADSTAGTEVGSVFVSNYPPYSVWSPEAVREVHRVLEEPPAPDSPLGLYLHIPFCRRRCKFCYFKVYTEKDSKDVQRYLDGLAREVEIYAQRPVMGGRNVRFVYFGGGTPSFISARHLESLAQRVGDALSWGQAEEITFECEPGTLTQAKLKTIRGIGVTRLSLGVENFNDAILAENGRAHLSEEIYRVMPWIEALDFDQLNIDLIAGMVGETWETWKDSVRRTVELKPDSVTIYQMELPYNTVYSVELMDDSGKVPVAGWETKRAWQEYAYEQLEAAGYDVSSAYTVLRGDGRGRFVYRDALWQGADLLGVGVASFSHLQGIHFQNHPRWDPYLEDLESGLLPLDRAYLTTGEDRLIREMILQLKLGRLTPGYFREKFGVEIGARFAPAWKQLAADGLLVPGSEEFRLTRQGLLQVDSLLPRLYDPRYRSIRYT
jgi:oxygen-independent coproporphyrinogen-3 oxidase